MKTKEPENCAFQYAYNRTYGGISIIVDKTGLTFSEAKKLYQEYKQDIISKLMCDDFYDVEVALWIDMLDKYSFGETYLYITDEYKTDGEKIWREVKEIVDL